MIRPGEWRRWLAAARRTDATADGAIAPEGPIGAPLAAASGWMVVAIVDVFALQLRDKLALLKTWTRALTRFYDLGEFATLALLSAGAVLAFQALAARLSSRPTTPAGQERRSWRAGARAIGAIAVAAVVLGLAILQPDLGMFADRHAERLPVPVRVAVPILAVGFSLIVPLATLVGRLAEGAASRLAAIVAGVALAFDGPIVLLHEYEAGNFFVAWAAAVMIGAALEGARLPLRVHRGDLRATAVVLALLAVVTGAVRPPAQVAAVLATSNGSVLAPVALWRPIDQGALADRAVIPPEQRAWFAPRAGLPDIPSTTPPADAAETIVILVTVDSLRADFVSTKKNDRLAPTLASLRDEGVYFSRARAAGSQTACSLSALFMGKYFSQQRWGDVDSAGRSWPSVDPSPRFPALLTARGVHTVLFDVLATYHGLMTGFAEVVPMQRSHRGFSAREIADGVIQRLDARPKGPLFMYGHVMDVHAPYAGDPDIPAEVRYKQEVAGVDKQIHRIRQAIDHAGLTPRTILIVSADHGEAFDEHGTLFHGQSLYDELLRVPLLVESGAFAPHQVDAPVSLIDLAPTLLDLFGAPTPGAFMGESLAPVLRGAAPHFTRPIVAENRLQQAMVFPDGVKVIRDLRFGGHHAFELDRDPGELHDLIDEPKFDAASRLALIGAFFRAHALADGYVTPYRR